MTLDEALKKVITELSEMPTDEFVALVNSHRDGDLAQLLQEVWKSHDEE